MSNNNQGKSWREDYILIQTWNEELEIVRNRWVHISVKDPLQYVIDFYPFERPIN